MRLILTVDTELSNFPSGQGLWGRTARGPWGLERLMLALREVQARATFFVDVYAKRAEDVAHQQRAVEFLLAHDHDVQLHTHPAPSFDPARERLRDYGLAEQREILEFGCERLTRWTGHRPTLHRAGDWGIDANSLRALRELGFRADFSGSPWSPNCAIERSQVSLNGWTSLEGLLCAIGTCYHDRITGRIRRVDIGGVSPAELAEMLSKRIDPFILTLHSFSLMRFNRSRTRFRPDPAYVRRLTETIALARRMHGYEVGDAATAVSQVPDDAVRMRHAALPVSTWGASLAGMLRSAGGRLGWAAG